MEHVIEHTTGIFIGLMLLACTAAILTKLVAHLPYTIALVLVGLGVGLLNVGPDLGETGFGRELVFFVFLPPLLFQGSLHLQIGRLFQHFWPIVTFASVGVLISTFMMGGMFWWIGGVGWGMGTAGFLVALLFGAMLSPTDPVSVLAIFKGAKVPKDLQYLVEGESLFNDGTGVVIFTIILDLIIRGGEFHVSEAALEFVKVIAGGTILGAALGTIVFLVLRALNDKLLENALCLLLAFGSFWLAEFFHFSGVIATVIAGLLIGNYGRQFSMSRATTATVENFFESIDFLINSLLFILIGLELQEVEWDDLTANLRPLIVAVAALLISRAITVYPLYGVLNLGGRSRPGPWAHVLFWGGLRGSIPVALLLGLPEHEALADYRTTLIVAVFGAVFFSLVVQGITMKPLLRRLKLQ